MDSVTKAAHYSPTDDEIPSRAVQHNAETLHDPFTRKALVEERNYLTVIPCAAARPERATSDLVVPGFELADNAVRSLRNFHLL
ncbi:hypothetical protein [Nocardia jiangsuensis]|uniref:Uncharacterized protein n=1 Tax=Nocardia jiangsuensis TaxID=1691563 RepID=A0ABV8DP82_9NOCA